MFRQLALSGLLATAIALSPAVTPQARAADPHDILGGAIALGVIGALIVNERNRDDRTSAGHVHTPPPRAARARSHSHGRYTHTHVYRGHHDHGKRHVRKRPAQRSVYPQSCLRQKWTAGGWKRYYSAACLRKHGY